MSAIKVANMDARVLERGRSFTTVRAERHYGASLSSGRLAPFDLRATTSTHEIHEFRLALQSILVAYDPETSTLYVGEPDRGGYVEQAAINAYHRGEPNPYMGEVLAALNDAHHARAARNHHARVVTEAVERLKSRKPGVRRRAKRLLAKLGK